MLSSLLIALREGLEAALIVGIVLVYLDRIGQRQLARYVWAGVILAVASSAVIAMALDHFQISEDGFEGLMLLAAAVFVVTMIAWMNHAARQLRGHIEKRVGEFAKRGGWGAGLGLGAFVYLMVVREGAELVLILRAVELSTEGLEVWIGTALGLGLAVAVGVFFFEGTLKVSLGKFFSFTSIILTVVAVQLAVTGLHELSEARWIASSRVEMAWIGPIVANDVFFYAVILGVAVLLVLREWGKPAAAPAPNAASAPAPQLVTDAVRRKLLYERRTQRRWMFAAAFTFVAVILLLAADFVYARVAAAPPPAELLTAIDGQVRVPTAQVSDNNLHMFRLQAGGGEIRFLIIKQPAGYGVALDACQICGRAGYRQEGANVICRNCGAAIYIPTIGQSGGCNPVGVASQVDGADIVVDVPALVGAEREVPQ
ncbi:MAG: Fe-S-containing protein [Candidatus Acidiferrales bacterium]